MTINILLSYSQDMNPEAQIYLDNILKKQPYEITQADKAFLQARISYLTEEQVTSYLQPDTQEDKKPIVKKLKG